MDKQRGIIIIGQGTDELARARAKELAKETGVSLLTIDEAKEMGFDNLPKGITEIPTLKLKNHLVDDYIPKTYEIPNGFPVPKKHNWSKNKKRRK